MEKFKELENLQQSELEQKQNDYWSSIDLLNKTIENRKDNLDFVFFDGPATANGCLVFIIC